MKINSSLKKAAKKVLRINTSGSAIENKMMDYQDRFLRYSFHGENCIDARQYEAVITRLYHTVEKGLSYLNYRAGFGKDNIIKLIMAMENYVREGYTTDAFFFRTALSTLQQYVEKNQIHGYSDPEIEERISKIPGRPNGKGGAAFVKPLSDGDVTTVGFKDFVMNRHSFRHFNSSKVELNRVKEAIELAQHTPSACNRQGWKARIVVNKEKIMAICSNQNGNRGFGQEFDMMILVTGDIRYFNRDRELFQVYIDGGMYAENILNSLHYYHIATVPLSASLTAVQELELRRITHMHEAEVPIILIGIGNYPKDDECLVARSERKPAEYEIID